LLAVLRIFGIFKTVNKNINLKIKTMRQLKITKLITNRESASLDKYLQDVSKEELITSEEEVQLAQRIKQGDQQALEKLVKTNLRFVISVAKQYQNQGLSLLDLINEGNIGLIIAAKRFDETRGFKFISYAVWWIRQKILQALAEQSRIIRLPLNQVGLLNKIKKAIPELEQDFEREPSIVEIAKKLEISDYEVQTVGKISKKHISIDAPISDEGPETFQDTHDSGNYYTDEGLMKESLKTEIQRSLATLTERERKVIILFYGLGEISHGLTLDEIGKKFGLTKERVRQIKEIALRRLKKRARSKLLKEYLG
jgi:RNA polymerase primary sigma factor